LKVSLKNDAIALMKQYNVYSQTTKLSKETTFLIDLDGTLVNTNYANYLAYYYAIKQILKFEISYDEKKRFTRNILNKTFPNIQASDLKRIVKLKENKYKNYLEKTKVNEELVILLQKYYKTNRIILVTKCHRERAEETLCFHKLSHYFTNKIFSQTNNKYKEAINNLQLSVSSVVIFEDDDLEVENAIKSGIPKQNINKVTFNQYEKI